MQKFLSLFYSHYLSRGQTLIELIIVMGIAAIILPALLTGFITSSNGKPQQQQRVQAVSVLKESESALKNIKNTNWESLTTNGTFHTQISGTQWALLPSSSTNSKGIKQEVVISDVLRDENGAIVTTGGIVDPSTKKIDIKISWVLPYASSINSTMYLTRTKNTTFIQTTIPDFNAGIPTNTIVASTSGSLSDGQVQLASTGTGGQAEVGGVNADWCEPNLSITALDLPKNGVANAITAIEGKVFAGTGDNSSGVSFANVSITNNVPPNSSIAGTFNGYKTNGVFGESSYSYLGTDNNSKEVVIVNTSTSPSNEAGYFNAPGNGSGNTVFVSGSIGYMTSGNKLYTFNLSSKSGSRPQLGTLTLDGTGKKIFVRGNYVYVAISSTSNQLEIVQVSNSGATLTKTSSFSVAGQAAQDVYIDSTGSRAYLATLNSATQREMFIINTTSKSNPTLVGSYEANGMNPKGVTAIIEHNKAILVGSGAEEYQVIDIGTEASPTRCGGLNIDTGVNGVSSVFEADGDAYSYIITGDSSAELKIIAGGPGGTFIDTNWCSPQDAIINSVTLPRQGNVITAKEGKAFIGTGDGTSGVEFTNVAITTPPPPTSPSSSIYGSYSGSQQTNGVYSDGNYAFIAVNGSTSQVLIINNASSPFTQVGTINVPGGGNANGVFVFGNIAYVTSGNKLYTFDVTIKTGVHSTALTQVTLYAEEGVIPVAKQVKVVGNKAFVGATGTAYGLQVFLFDPTGSSARLVGVSDLSYKQNATGISINSLGTRAYVSFNNGTGTVAKGFYIVDTSTGDQPVWWPLPNFYTAMGTYNSGSTDPTGIALAAGSNNRVILTGNGGTNQYHSVDISVESDPLLCGGLAISSGIKGIASIKDQYQRGFSYIITGEATNQFKIIQGGSGGGSFTEDGVFESSTFIASTSASFNRFTANIIKPAPTTLRMQVAAAPQVSGSCSLATYTYVGPDGSATSYFSPSGNAISATIPFGNHGLSYANPAKCFKFKTWFTTWDTEVTPIFNDITVNYSP
ncbi:MAG TPA: hypothetical protein VM077_01330 [Candidatus Limnocylindrales bacterium]|nr:hypothetical protein [Candidatus Limnocylindrales bacterium]